MTDHYLVPSQNDKFDSQNQDLSAIVESAIEELHVDTTSRKVHKISFAELNALGAGFSSLMPGFFAQMQTAGTNTSETLYRVTNLQPGDILKMAKDGMNWGAIKREDGSSAMAKLKEVKTDLSQVTGSKISFDPASAMMAAALVSIEQKLSNIEEMEQDILSFLEIEKESKIEADVKTLAQLITNYKYNWNNELFMENNHKLVLDIQRAARANLVFYQRKIDEEVKERQLLVAQRKVESTQEELTKKFQYFRLSLFNYGLASLIEIMLSGNFQEGYVNNIRHELEKNSMEYRELFAESSVYLEKLASASLEKNVLKGLGKTGKAMGKMLSKVPEKYKRNVDEFLQNTGDKLENSAKTMEEGTIKSFARLGDPGTRMLTTKMEDLKGIFNHTTAIGVDEEGYYLVEETAEV